MTLTPIGAFSMFAAKFAGLGEPAREGIMDLIAVDQKGIVSRGRSPMAFNLKMVYKKINYRLIRLKVGTVGVSKEA